MNIIVFGLYNPIIWVLGPLGTVIEVHETFGFCLVIASAFPDLFPPRSLDVHAKNV